MMCRRQRASGGGASFAATGLAAWVALLLCAAAGAAEARGGGADGEFERRESSHFVLYQDVDIDERHGLRGSRRFEQQVLRVLETAYRSLDERLGLRPRQPITVVVHDPALFQAEFGGLVRFSLAGFYAGAIHVKGATAVSQRLVAVLHHELVHAFLDAEVPAALPAWLNEGLAEWFEHRAAGKRSLSAWEAETLYRVASAGALFGLADLSSGSFAGFAGDAARQAYLQSYAFFEYLDRAHGEDALRHLVSDLRRGKSVERALRRSFGAELPRLEERYRASLLGAG